MPPTALTLNRYTHEAMTTVFEVIVAGASEDYALHAAETVFREIDRLEGLLSRYVACSDISQVNRLRPGERVRVAPDVFECLAIAAWASDGTGGAFDATIGPLVSLRRECPGALDETAWRAARRRVGMQRLELDDAVFAVGVRPAEAGQEESGAGVELDLGGIGKGFALDKAADILEEWDIDDYLLSSGGSTVLAAGSRDAGEGWLTGVGAEWGKAAGIETLRLAGEAMSGSGTESRGEHIIDPATGRPASSHLAAWAVCPSAAVSDALSTAFMVMPTPAVQAFCAGHGHISAYVVEPDGRLVAIGRRAHE